MIQPIGYFLTWRGLYSKPIWLNSSLEQQVILMTLMAMANFKPNEWEWQGEKFIVKEGQFITSLESIRVNTGGNVSIQNIRTALRRFEKLGFLTNESTKTGRLITLVNWQSYQVVDGKLNNDINKDLTDSQQRANKDLTPIEEGNKVNNDNKEDCITIVEYLNTRTGKNFKHSTKSTIKSINARLNEGFTVEEIKAVIDNKSKEWKSDKKMEQYLRPSTLFGTKFEGYLNEKSTKLKLNNKEMAKKRPSLKMVYRDEI